jgi:hypothetical protein
MALDGEGARGAVEVPALLQGRRHQGSLRCITQLRLSSPPCSCPLASFLTLLTSFLMPTCLLPRAARLLALAHSPPSSRTLPCFLMPLPPFLCYLLSCSSYRGTTSRCCCRPLSRHCGTSSNLMAYEGTYAASRYHHQHHNCIDFNDRSHCVNTTCRLMQGSCPTTSSSSPSPWW